MYGVVAPTSLARFADSSARPPFAATRRFGMVVGKRSGEVLMKRKLATIVLVGVVFGLGAVAVTAAGAANSTTTTTTTHCANPAPTPTTTRCR
jgi:hypothetical protein